MLLDNIIQYTYIVGEGLGHVAPLRCLEIIIRDFVCTWPQELTSNVRVDCYSLRVEEVLNYIWRRWINPSIHHDIVLHMEDTYDYKPIHAWEHRLPLWIECQYLNVRINYPANPSIVGIGAVSGILYGVGYEVSSQIQGEQSTSLNVNIN